MPLLDPLLIPELAASGTGTGLPAGLLRIGGGSLMVPCGSTSLAQKGYPSDYTLEMALATPLATIMFPSMPSLRARHKRGAVRCPVVTGLAPATLVGALVGAQIAH